ncbi:MAG TPA: MFS transporter, partial [Bryobacteraceae bacterium]|nr:MFS transporter [Bryobacteraceae bacterium]
MTTATPKVTPAQWRVLTLMAISVWINYVDRANLSVAAPQLRSELSLNAADLGILLSAFFWTYAALQPAAGWLVDRFNVCWALAIGYFLWSGATAVTGAATSFQALLVFRLLLGAGESIAYPAYSKLLMNYFPRHRLALANAIIDAGAKLGPAAGTLIGGLLVARLGWRIFFIALGLISLLWLLPWAMWAPRASDRLTKEAPAGSAGPGFGDILRLPVAWGTFIGHFGGNYLIYFLLTWLPSYLVSERGFTMDEMAVFGSLPYVVIAASAILMGWFSDRLIQRGASVTRVRIGFAAGGLAGSAIIVLVPLIPGHLSALAVLAVACASYGAFTPNLWAIPQTISGPEATGKWSGLQNCFGNFAGVIAPALTGFVVSQTGRFSLAFVS